MAPKKTSFGIVVPTKIFWYGVPQKQLLIQCSPKTNFCFSGAPENIFWTVVPKKHLLIQCSPKNIFWYSGPQNKSFDKLVPQNFFYDTVFPKNQLLIQWSSKIINDAVVPKKIFWYSPQKIILYSDLWNSWCPKKSFETVVPKKHLLIQHIRLLQKK